MMNSYECETDCVVTNSRRTEYLMQRREMRSLVHGDRRLGSRPQCAAGLYSGSHRRMIRISRARFTQRTILRVNPIHVRPTRA